MTIYYKDIDHQILCFSCAVQEIIMGAKNIKQIISHTRNVLVCDNCKDYIDDDIK